MELMNVTKCSDKRTTMTGPSRRRKTAALRVIAPWVLAVVSVAMFAGGCTPAGISSSRKRDLIENVQHCGLIVGFEGLQPFSGFRIKNLAQTIGDELDLEYSVTSGNYEVHLPIIEKAHTHKQPIYLIGYSMGGNQARLLAEECDRRNIPVRMLFLLDPEYMVSADPGKVPGNVRKVVVCTSTTYHLTVGTIPGENNLADASRTSLLIEDCPEAGHMGLPESMTSWILEQIARDMKRQ